ncbi:LysE family translocator [Massilia yuzhufengensis]|uniref:Threonine/homoserine/homoserine lactone efflux protein n=1 Tax=Massilia yuzhufengensis TaxID=1164594 RepID=A0A1I1NTG3_9BURK|nr:LysE family translocator [Massilia yuzhufengensis]SFD00837.1 Threonine/homoserine/homoserine lactone efflux protein [Massilia yuzhufengensis]
MADFAHLWLFFIVVFGVIALPGLDMAFVLASALRGGNGAGLAAVGGIVLGGAAHIVMGVLGVAAILAVWPPLFNAVLLAGAVYIGWIGWTLLRARAGVALPVAGRAPRGRSVFLQGMLTCLLNPKAYVFMLAIFPQFLRPERGHLWTQATALGLITAFTQAAVYGTVAVGAVRAHGWLAANPRAGLAAARAVGAVLMAAALLTVLKGWS